MQRMKRRTRGAFLALAVLPVLLALLILWTRSQYRDRVAWVTHTQRVLSTIDNLVLAMTRAETNQRGYLLTGAEPYLVPLRDAERSLSERVVDLRSLTTDTPDARGQVETLERLTQGKLTEVHRTIDLRSHGDTEAANALVRSNEGLQLMDRINEAASELRKREESRLTERLRDQYLRDVEVTLAVLGSVACMLALLAWSAFLIERYARQRDTADAELSALNRDLERRVAERTESLMRSNLDLQQFAYAASHDLQEPLRVVASYVDLLRKRYQGRLDADADVYIRFAVDGAKRMQELVNDLLAYAKAGTQALNREIVETDTLVSEVLNSLRETVRETEAVVTHGPLPPVWADRLKLSLVFQNLIANAIKFTSEGQPPVVEVGCKDGFLEHHFFVRDRGIGFDQEYADRIFLLFQRLHSGDRYPGTGIGLALSKRIVEGHGGRIWAESKAGEGATFHFTLPALPARGRTAGNE